MTITGENKNKFPIKIRVNFKVRAGRKNKYIVRRYHICPDQVFAKPGDEYRRKKNDAAVILCLSKAMELRKKNLSVQEFERLYTGSGGLEDIKTVFDYAVKKLREEERDGTAGAYQQALNSFIAYKGEFISFDSVTVDWLKAYEKWMLKKGKSINTVGMYCRALKAMFNLAARMKIISRDILPFGVGLYVVPSGKRKTKKAFTQEEKNLILSYRSKREDVNRALDFWAYQLFSSGCNMADVAYLQNKNIDGEWVEFDRKKTENTERNKESISVYLTPRMREIIAKHGNKSLGPEAYVFPILKADMTSRERKRAIKNFLIEINELLAVAQKEINKTSVRLAVKLTTGTARYTAVTLLKKHGIELKTIAKALGHGSEATTEHYTEEGRETQILISRALAL